MLAVIAAAVDFWGLAFLYAGAATVGVIYICLEVQRGNV